jgi:hypothetical protein
VTAFDVTYVSPAARGAASGLDGRGSFAIGEGGIALRGSMPRTGVASGVAGAVAFVVTVFALFFSMDLLDEWLRSEDGDMRLFVAIGLVVLLGTFAGVRALLVRALPKRVFESSITFPFIAWMKRDGARVEFATHTPGLDGITAFETPDAARLVDELEAESSGPQGGYRGASREEARTGR